MDAMTRSKGSSTLSGGSGFTRDGRQHSGSQTGNAAELLLLVFTVGGITLFVLSLFLSVPWQEDLCRSIGLSLFPAGVVSYMLARYATKVLDDTLVQHVTAMLRDRLQEGLADMETNVSAGVDAIAQHVAGALAPIPSRLDQLDSAIERRMKGFEQDMDRSMDAMSPLYVAVKEYGLENIYLTRLEALADFGRYLDAELERAGAGGTVWIVSSSIKGFLTAANAAFDGRGMMERIASCGCDLRILMTHPDVADARAKQEHRAEGEIPQEVNMNLALLKRLGVRRECIRFYKGTPTVFAIATKDKMLLNPYPYEAEAYRCFSMIVARTASRTTDIYQQYLRHHFEEPWSRKKMTEDVSEERWAKLEDDF